MASGRVSDNGAERPAELQGCGVCGKPWPDEYGAWRQHAGCLLKRLWRRLHV